MLEVIVCNGPFIESNKLSKLLLLLCFGVRSEPLVLKKSSPNNFCAGTLVVADFLVKLFEIELLRGVELGFDMICGLSPES